MTWVPWSEGNPIAYDADVKGACRIGKGEKRLTWEVDGRMTVRNEPGDIECAGELWEVKNPVQRLLRWSPRLSTSAAIERVVWRILRDDRREGVRTLAPYRRMLGGFITDEEEDVKASLLIDGISGLVLVDAVEGFYVIPNWAVDSEVEFSRMSLYMLKYRFVGRGRDRITYYGNGRTQGKKKQ